MKLALFIISENLRGFFWTFDLFSRKKTSFERFENFWAIVQLEMHSIKKIARVSDFWKNQAILRKKRPFFPMKTKIWMSWELMSNIKNQDALKKLAKFSVSKRFPKFFLKRSIHLSEKPQFRKFRDFSATKIFLVHTLDEVCHVLVFEISRGFFLNIIFFSRKNQFWTFWEFLSKNTIRDHSMRNLPKLAIFEKIRNFLRKKTSFFSKKSKVWMFWGLLSFNTIWDAS